MTEDFTIRGLPDRATIARLSPLELATLKVKVVSAVSQGFRRVLTSLPHLRPMMRQVLDDLLVTNEDEEIRDWIERIRLDLKDVLP